MNGWFRESALRAWYASARVMVAAPLFFLFRLKVEGLDNLPREGPVIIASNHRSYMDPPAVAVACPRRVHFMAKKSLFGSIPARALLTSLGGFPVDRERIDREAIRTALWFLEQGRVLGIFPEGTRGRGDLGRGLDGTAWLALKAGCPVLPVAVIGTEEIMQSVVLSFRLKRLVVRFGEPIWPTTGAAQTEEPGTRRPAAAGTRRREMITDEIMRRIGDLLCAEPVSEGAGDG